MTNERIRSMIKSTHPGDVEIALRFLGATTFNDIKKMFPEGHIDYKNTKGVYHVALNCNINLPNLKIHNSLYIRTYKAFVVFEFKPIQSLAYTSIKDII